MNLSELKQGQKAIVVNVGGEGSLRQHFLDMGLIPGSEIKLIKFAPMGDPMELLIHGYSLTLRLADAAKIEVDVVDTPDEETTAEPLRGTAHPGLGETGKYHSKDHENPVAKGTILTFALAGNQNCGKTTLFNQITGSNQHVGNFPGVTVDRKDGVIKGHPDTLVTDLPGIYSLSPYTEEEIVSRKFILEQKPKGIINILDASNIERNLYLTLQLMELHIPMVLALNMMDEVNNNGGAILINNMERELGVPVVPISAAKNEGIDELIAHAIHVAKYQEQPARTDFCDKDDFGGAVHRCRHGIRHLIERRAEDAGIPVDFAASKIIEGDHRILQLLNLDRNEKDTIEHIICQMEEERGLDRAAAIADMRFSFIRKLCKNSVIKPKLSKERIRSNRMDKVLTGKYTAIPTFILILCLVFWLTFDVIGAWLQDGLQTGIDWLGNTIDIAFQSWNVSPAVRSLVVDAIFGGVGSVVSFVPIIIVLFFFLSLMEDSGYMARVAFVTDKLLRRLGLSGRSIVPLLVGFGCSVPAVMATRTLPSATDRKRTIILAPFMSCSAKVAIYGFLTSAFFPKNAGLVMIGLYLLGILCAIIVALVEKMFKRHSEAAPFVMELPTYRLPGWKNTFHLLWEKTRDFLQKAFSVILVATIVIWFFQSFDFHFRLVESENSMLAWLAGLIAPLFAPLGLGDWKIVTALISGVLAKESVVATLEVLNATVNFTPLTALSLLVFSLLYTPCVATIATIRKELSSRWAAFVACFQLVVAWVVTYLIYLIAGLFL